MFRKLLIATMVGFAAFSITNGQERGDHNDNRCGQSSSIYGGDSHDNLRIIGLTSDQRLICFKESNPRNARNIGTVTGLGGTDTLLIGIDFRVQDGKLYGVGNGGGVYTINTTTAVATRVNSLTIALSGTAFGVDFNPVADRLRIVSDTGQNLRHNVNTGGVTLNDGILTYTAPPTAPVTAVGITGAAYTNNDVEVAPGTTATTLFDIDTNLDQVSIQSPANNGILVATGKLGFDATGPVGFDIYSELRDGVTTDAEGFASLTSAADSITRLYSISLLTGKARSRGAFNNDYSVVDIAVPLDQ